MSSNGKRAESTNVPKKRGKRPAIDGEGVREDRTKRARTSEGVKQPDTRTMTMERLKKAEGSRGQTVRRRSPRKPKSTKSEQPHHDRARTDGEQTNPQNITCKADNHISVEEMAELVKKLNAEIRQVSCLLMDSLRLSGSESRLGSALNELRDYLGEPLCNEFQCRSNYLNTEPHPLIMQIVLQTGLVNACNRIINGSSWDRSFWGKDHIFSRIARNIKGADQDVVDTWQGQAHMTASLHTDQEVNGKYLTEVIRELITVIDWPLQSGSSVSSQYNKKLEGIALQAVELQKIIGKDATSGGVVTYTIPCDVEFDRSKMDDMKQESNETTTIALGKVICTVEMGLCYGKTVQTRNGVSGDFTVVVKPVVVLAGTLEACSATLEKRFKQLEANVTEMHQKNAENAKDIERLKARIVELEQLLVTKRTTPRNIEGTADADGHVLPATRKMQGVKTRLTATKQSHHTIVEGEQTQKLSASARRADSISVMEVAELVRVLNTQIEQTSLLVADLLSYKGTLIPHAEVRSTLEELRDHIGQWLHDDLLSRSEHKMELDPLITQITIQTGLINACCGIINGSPLSINGLTPLRISNDILGSEVGHDIAGSKLLTHSQSEHKEAIREHLMKLFLKLITVAGGSSETVQYNYDEKVKDITKQVIELYRIIRQDVTSVELTTYTIRCATNFDPAEMEDTERERDTRVSIPGGEVVCTLEMGLLCRKKVTQAKRGKLREELGVTMKAKVVLAATLETES